MKLSKCLMLMIMLTMIALIYIHLQIQIYDLAYQGKNREITVRELAERNGDIQYDICVLKSARHLGGTLLNEGSIYQFLDRDHIVEVKVPPGRFDRTLAKAAPAQESFFSRIFSLRAQAEAKTLNK